MDVMLHVSSAEAAPIVAGLGGALSRAGADWSIFLTNDGVRILNDPEVRAATAGATRIVLCEHSWEREMGDREPPAERGSQTINSDMMAACRLVVSL